MEKQHHSLDDLHRVIKTIDAITQQLDTTDSTWHQFKLLIRREQLIRYWSKAIRKLEKSTQKSTQEVIKSIQNPIHPISKNL